jgi:hypothetical protein
MDKAQFEEQRSKMMEKALKGLEQLNSNLHVLNRNLETVSSIGIQSTIPSEVWTSFHRGVAPNVEDKEAKAVEAVPRSRSIASSMGEEQRIGKVNSST